MLRDVKSGRDDIICLQELFDLTVINRVVRRPFATTRFYGYESLSPFRNAWQLREIGAGKPEIRRPVSAELNGESSVGTSQYACSFGGPKGGQPFDAQAQRREGG